MEPGLRRQYCKTLGIGKSSFYAPPTTLKLRDNIAIGELSKLHLENPYYGVRRFAMALGWSENKARRIRDLDGIKAEIVRRKHRYRKTKAEIPAPNNLVRNFARLRHLERPQDGEDYSGMTQPMANIWTQDFTYLKTRAGIVFVAMVLRLSSRDVVGWSIKTNHSAELTKDALLDALSRHKPPSILHNDRGSEYLSYSVEKLCKTAGIKMSASSPNSPWQNGFCERIMNTLKNEGDSFYHIDDLAELTEAIAQRIYYYNHKRIHTKLKMPPAAYAKKIGLDEVDKVSGKMGA